MKLIKPSYRILDQAPGLNGIYQQIELAARTAYKSEHLITDDSAKKMVDRLVKLEHGATLEHGTVYLKVPKYEWEGIFDHISDYRENPYSIVRTDDVGNYCITTNYRVLAENDWFDDLEYLCSPTKYHIPRITVKFILDRATAQEYTRHRTFSFLMESQRQWRLIK